MRRIKITLSILIVITVGWVVGAFIKNSWNTQDQSRRKIPEPKKSQASMEIKDVHYSHTNEDALKEWELNAKSAQFFKEKNLVIFKDVVVTFYSKEGKRYTLTGDQGQLFTDTQNIILTGSVVGKGYQGEFHTNSLKYDAQERKMRTSDKVRFQGKQLGVEGVGMVVDVEKERLSLLNDVRAQGKK